ncbi:hypothetical protein MATR_32320 [Marivirga tractuosa]|uniref:DUF2490 domain-containing protein n=1 Tax=Marivirga tractuosa (strain ATCC 23168 / DSM 4126 / NBRC 15989 / NCIMB 1408 / VKM B-1430 / H-43) TaxID=643867 RepID=E4TSX8_MARTH|nr:DUF2490 domain-containing protein [Marivirga tractuosa]ADR22919.1 Protein of unknown function DUF2490 [Marivirga tractuosa DSM 4126]BDD16407.1 hypothetical protein MATR_32320 [Marivirga tractuosa]
MTTYFTKFLFIVFISIPFLGNTQHKPSLRWEPGISVTKKIDSRWSYNMSISGRQRFTNYGEGESNLKTDRWEIKSFGTYTLFGGKKLSLGYMYRTVDPFEPESGWEHRITQQFAFITNFGGYRLGNKFRIEQRIRSSVYLTRLRYAISNDFPLQGESLDPKEFYLIGGNELVYAFNGLGDELENRFSLGIGRLIKGGQKLQFSVQSRYSDLISSNRDHIIQFESVYYFNL